MSSRKNKSVKPAIMTANVPISTENIVEKSVVEGPAIDKPVRKPTSTDKLVYDKLPHRDVLLGPMGKKVVARQTRLIVGSKWYLCSKDAEAEIAMAIDRVTEKLQELNKLGDASGHLGAKDKLTLLNTLRNMEYVIQPAIKLWDRTKREFYAPKCANCDKPAIVAVSMAEWRVASTDTLRPSESIPIIDDHSSDMALEGVHPSNGMSVIINGKRITQ